MYNTFQTITLYLILAGVFWFLTRKFVAGIKKFAAKEKVTAPNEPEKKCSHCG